MYDSLEAAHLVPELLGSDNVLHKEIIANHEDLLLIMKWFKELATNSPDFHCTLHNVIRYETHNKPV